MPVLRPRRADARAHRRDLLDVTLDAAQRAAVERPPGSAMLVLGEAGYGKTTVALARLAHLHAKANGRLRAIVLVPNDGLAGLLRSALVRLGVDLPVRTYARWARSCARRAFGDLPRRESAATSVAVARIKRDPALLPLLDARARLPPGVIDDDFDAPPPTTHALAHRGDLQHLFGERPAMEALVGASEQRIGAHAVDEIVEHTRIQFLARAEDEYAYVDAERLKTSDGRSLDAGTATEDAASVDVEDYAVLFALDRLRAALGEKPSARLPRYECIVLDEAQELAPIELALIGRCLALGGTLVVAGDADQQVDPTACFRGWASTMRELDADVHETVRLEVGYRCPAETMRLARAVRDGASAAASSAAPAFQAFDDEESLFAWLRGELASLDEEDPTATVCVVARRPHLAKRVASALAGKVPRRLVLDGVFVRHRGADVSTVDLLKGLEFDVVIVVDASAAEYPDTAASRRALYVALTRARHQAAIACVGAPSPLLSRS